MKYLSLVSLCAMLALIPACYKNGSCYQQSCCPTTSCETQSSSSALEAQPDDAAVAEAPAMSAPQKEESIEIDEEIDEKEDLSSDKEDLDGNDDSQSAQA